MTTLEESDGREYRVFGPPGTGKTTNLSHMIKKAVEARGSEAVMVASFTRAAARELAGRELPIAREQIGTLHAQALRAIGSVQIAESRLDNWNEMHPSLTMTDGRRAAPEDADEIASGDCQGDALMSEVQRRRGMMDDKRFWPSTLRGFWDKWTEWKNDSDLMDFTDLLEYALEHCETAPGNPSVGFFDECQDFTPLELALVRKWGGRMERVVLTGDPNQNLYRFKGATSRAFMDPPVPESQERTLSKSYRLPSVIHAFAEKWLSRQREGRMFKYAPTREGGVVRRIDATARQPEDAVATAARLAEAGKSVMILAACSYSLVKTIRVLREGGIAFANRFRRKRGDWNPLCPRRRGITMPERILAFLRPFERIDWVDHCEHKMWTGADLKAWVPLIDAKSSILNRGAKEAVKRVEDDHQPQPDELFSWFDQAEFQRLLFQEEQPLAWLVKNTLGSKRHIMDFPVKVLARGKSTTALAEEPLITIGTIHSVKGGEADVVIVMPDLSCAGMTEWTGSPEEKDAIVRQFYVAFTRAREEIILMEPSGGMKVDF